MSDWVEIDGSAGEGGGQILRSSLALSLLTGKAFHMFAIRAGRERPGLQPQHLMCVRAAASIGQARVRGAELGSRELSFSPGKVRGGKYHFAIGTAGATGLVLHTLYLPLALATEEASEVVIEGGTHVSASPCFHFLDSTWRAYLEALGLKIKLVLRRPGFYPRGGGTIEARIKPSGRLRGMQLLERQMGDRLSGISAVSGLPESIAQRQSKRALARLRNSGFRIEIEEQLWQGAPGTMLALSVETRPAPTLFFGLGARGKRAERVADEAVDQLMEFVERTPAAVDPYSADQLVLPLVFADGPSTFTVSEVTPHLLTNVEVIRAFVDRPLKVIGDIGEAGRVEIR
ncbi:MAG: ribosomal subunit interface protein [Gemmatales bacterium]|nr:MAG: ribosomal subunit interface protein [Gemmatales bacterium]